MDNFRWILLAVGAVIILIIYLISRKNRRDFYQEDEDPSEDLPDINTRKWDDLDEGVGEVRIIARNNDYQPPSTAGVSAASRSGPDGHDADEYDEDENDPLFAKWPKTMPASEPAAETEAEVEAEHGSGIEPESEPQPAAETESVAVAAAQEPEAAPTETVIVLTILARDGSVLTGDSINSVARANDMVFGDMSIYHRVDARNEPVFSLVNMVKPGSFDPATIHELSTPGISLFMQLPGPSNPGAAYDDMLQTAYRMSETLEARLCDRSRQPLTQSVVDEYRSIAASFDGKA